jgi:hypothetical protein
MTRSATNYDAQAGVIQAAVAQIQTDRRWLTLARLVFAAAALSWFGLLVWALPSVIFPTAVGAGAAIVLLSVFSAAAAGFTLASWIVWKPVLQDEELSELFAFLSGGQKYVRGPAQFRRRLALECRRAKADPDGAFMLIIARASGEAADPRRRVASTDKLPLMPALIVRGAARTDDVVAEASPNEVWLIARGVPRDLRESVVSRLTSLLGEPGTEIGYAAFGDDGTQPETLLEVASGRISAPKRARKAA